jgi:hypothetical protein
MKSEKYYKQTFDYWMDWMTRPEDVRSPMERIGCYATIYSMFEFRLRCLVFENAWENDYNLLKKIPLQKGKVSSRDGYRNITIKEYKDYKEGSSDIFGMGTMTQFLNSLKFNRIVSDKDYAKIREVVDFRNTLLHRTMFKHKNLTDEHIEEIIKCFRMLDARLQTRRRRWKRMKKVSDSSNQKIL